MFASLKTTPLCALSICIFLLISCGKSGDDYYQFEEEFEEGQSPSSQKISSALYPRCEQRIEDPLWAQFLVGSDLAREELKSLGADLTQVRVAVLDTGFDSKHREKAFKTGPLSLRKGHDKAGDPHRDERGHGTLVSSFIAGPYGLANGVDLRIYRVTEAGANGSVHPDLLTESVKRACEEGADIINLSWGGVDDESGEEPDEVTRAELIKFLEERGCLVMKASGNDSYRHEKLSGSLEDPYLRVAAMGPIGVEADFTTSGEVAAPGERVFGLQSLDIEEEEDSYSIDEKTCGGMDGEFTSGTSFAAPITAGIAAMTLAALKTHGEEFTSLPAATRIRILNRILRASMIGGVVNAYRAVLIAKNWKISQDDAAPKDYASLFDGSHFDHCDLTDAPACLPSQSDEAIKSCVQKSRRQIFSCSLQGRAEQMKSLVELLVDRDHIDLASGIFRIAVDSGEMSAEDKKSAAEQMWKVYVKKWTNEVNDDGSLSDNTWALRFNIQIDPALDLLLLRTRFAKATESDSIKQGVSALLGAYYFSERMSRVPGRGGEEFRSQLKEIFILIQNRLSKDVIPSLLRASFDALKADVEYARKETFEHSKLDLRIVTSAVILVDLLLSDPVFKAHRAQLLEYSSELKNILSREEIIVDGVYGRRAFLRSIVSDANHLYAPYFQNLLNRHFPVDQMTEDDFFKNQNAVVILLLLNSYPELQTPTALLKLLEAINKGLSWNLRTTDQIVDYIVDDLKLHAESLRKDKIASEDFSHTYFQALEPPFLSPLLWYEILNFRGVPTTSPQYHRQVRYLAAMLSALPDYWIHEESFEMSYGIGMAFRATLEIAYPPSYLSNVDASALEGTIDEEVCVPLEKPSNTRSPRCMRVRVVAESVSELIDDYLNLSLQRLYRNSDKLSKLYWLKHLVSEPQQLLEALHQNPTAKSRLQMARAYILRHKKEDQDLKELIEKIDEVIAGL